MKGMLPRLLDDINQSFVTNPLQTLFALTVSIHS